MTEAARQHDLREQMPGPLAWVDDPWGIVWRSYHLARGFHPGRAARLVTGLFRNIRFERPVFIVGVSRSGTTLLFRLLRDSPSLGALPGEGHNLWRAFHHPRYSGWRSDAVGPGEVRRGERRFVAAYLRSYFPHSRFVEKTPENSFRIPYLLDLFPDARFIVMWRDPLETISSLIQAWRDPRGRFRSYIVPEDLKIPGYPHRRRWCFALIEGWRGLKSASIPEIVCAQWSAYVKTIAAARQHARSDRWHELYFEDLLRDPHSVIRRVCDFAEVAFDAGFKARMEELINRPVYALREPKPRKRRSGNREEILTLMPSIQSLAPLAGYSIEQADGDWTARPAATKT